MVSRKVVSGYPKKDFDKRKEVNVLALDLFDLFDLLRVLERRYSRLSSRLKVKT